MMTMRSTCNAMGFVVIKAIAFSPDGQFAYVLNAHDYTVSTLAIARQKDVRSAAKRALKTLVRKP